VRGPERTELAARLARSQATSPRTSRAEEPWRRVPARRGNRGSVVRVDVLRGRETLAAACCPQQEGMVTTPFRITVVAVLLASLLSALAACAGRKERSGTRDTDTQESGRRSNDGNGGGGGGGGAGY
jgi:hypothetical protein